MTRILAFFARWHHAREAARTIKGILATEDRARKEARK